MLSKLLAENAFVSAPNGTKPGAMPDGRTGLSDSAVEVSVKGAGLVEVCVLEFVLDCETGGKDAESAPLELVRESGTGQAKSAFVDRIGSNRKAGGPFLAR